MLWYQPQAAYWKRDATVLLKQNYTEGLNDVWKMKAINNLISWSLAHYNLFNILICADELDGGWKTHPTNLLPDRTGLIVELLIRHSQSTELKTQPFIKHEMVAKCNRAWTYRTGNSVVFFFFFSKRTFKMPALKTSCRICLDSTTPYQQRTVCRRD